MSYRPSGEFEPRDEAFLSTFCPRGGEGFALIAARSRPPSKKGHRVGNLARFLEDGCEGGVPPGARALFDDMEHRAAMLSITGHALLIECIDPEVGRELARNRQTKRLCTVTEDGAVIVVPSEWEAACKNPPAEPGALRRL